MSSLVIISAALAIVVFCFYLAAAAVSPKYLVLFLLFESLMFFSFFDSIAEFEIYLMALIAYSYLVTSNNKMTIKSSCFIMCLLCLFAATDAYLHEHETAFYRIVEYLFACSHIIIAISVIYKSGLLSRIFDSAYSILYHSTDGVH